MRLTIKAGLAVFATINSIVVASSIVVQGGETQTIHRPALAVDIDEQRNVHCAKSVPTEHGRMFWRNAIAIIGHAKFEPGDSLTRGQKFVFEVKGPLEGQIDTRATKAVPLQCSR